MACGFSQLCSSAFLLNYAVDPNKDRREAVKRKTTQYLKRAEEIFITHLQDNLVKGSSHLGVRVSHESHLGSSIYAAVPCFVRQGSII